MIDKALFIVGISLFISWQIITFVILWGLAPTAWVEYFLNNPGKLETEYTIAYLLLGVIVYTIFLAINVSGYYIFKGKGVR